MGPDEKPTGGTKTPWEGQGFSFLLLLILLLPQYAQNAIGMQAPHTDSRLKYAGITRTLPSCAAPPWTMLMTMR